MEPSEAAALPVPASAKLISAYAALKGDRRVLEDQLRDGQWEGVVEKIDRVLLQDTYGLSADEAASLREAAEALRSRRIGRSSNAGPRDDRE